MIDFVVHNDQILPLAEFLYNISYHSSIAIAIFDALYGTRCRSLIGWIDAFRVRPWGTNIPSESLEKVKYIQVKLLAA